MESLVLVGLLYLGFAVVPASIAPIPWRHRDSPGGLPLTIAVVGAAATTVFHGLSLLLPTLVRSPFVRLAAELGFAVSVETATLGTVYLAAEYTGRTWLKQRRLVAALVTISLVTATGGVLVRYVPDVPVPWLFQTATDGFTILVSAAALVFLGQQFLQSRGVYRKQSGALFIGFGLATGLGALQVVLEPPVFNLVPIGVTLGSGVIAWALFRYEVLQTVPIAREMLFEHMADPVVAFDGDGHVADYNDAAADLFGFEDGSVGQPIETLFPETPTLVARYVDVLSSEERVGAVIEGEQRHFDRDHPTVGALLDPDSDGLDDQEVGMYVNGDIRHYHVTVSGFGNTPQSEGRLVVFRDTTPQKRREDELNLLKEVLARVLRHNLRNDVTAIKGYAEMVREQGEDDIAQLAEKIVDTSDDLIRTSRKARRIEDVIETDRRVDIPLREVTTSAIASVAENYPEGTYEQEIPAGIVVHANPLLGTAIADAVENGVVHSDADDPRVKVTASRDGPWVEVTVTDNGPGIPRRELMTLQQGGETALVHSSGAGLWLIDTVIQESGGEVTYETDDGTTVRMYLRAAEPDAGESAVE